jgi:putative transposase
MSSKMPNYRRKRVQGGCYFFTVNLLNRRSSLLVDHIDVLRIAIRKVKSSFPFHIDAMVVLPDHLHCILTLPVGDDDFSTRWSQIKSRFSHQIPKMERASLSRKRRRERGVWQRRFWEHAIGDEDDYNNHIDYIHFNPSKHGWADRPIDWPYSSLHRFVREGIWDTGWGTGEFQPAVEVEHDRQ